MSFLHPSVLAALAAASIPILLYLLNRRARNGREVSSLLLLEASNGSGLRSRRPDRLFVLTLRLSTLILVVLAFSGPRSSDAIAGEPVRLHLILDRSPSMVDPDRTVHDLLDSAIVDLADDTDIVVYHLGGYRTGAVAVSGDRTSVLAAGDRNLPSDTSVTAEDLQAALTHVAARFEPGDEIRVVSDFRFRDVETVSLGMRAPVRSARFVRVDAPSAPVLSIDTAFLRSVRPGIVDVAVRILGEPRQEAVYTLEAQTPGWKTTRPIGMVENSAEILLAIPIDRSREIRECRLGVLEDGNRFGHDYLIGIRSVERPIRQLGESRLVEEVLSLKPGLDMTIISVDDLANLGNRDILLIADPRMLTERHIGTLASFVSTGGRLLVTLPHDRPSSIIREFLTEFGIDSRQRSRPVYLEEVDRTHPLLAPAYSTETEWWTPPDSMVVSSRLALSSTNQVLVLSDGSGLLHHVRDGAGEVVVVVTGAGSDGDLVRTGLVVPMMLGPIDYLGGGVGLLPTVRPGQPMVYDRDVDRIATGSGGDLWWRDESGEESDVYPHDPGLYVAFDSSGEIIDRFVVDMDPREFRGLPLSDVALRGLYRNQIKDLSIERLESIARRPHESAQIWRLLSLFGLLLLVFEAYVSSSFRVGFARRPRPRPAGS